MPEHAGWFFDSVTLSNFALAGGLHVVAGRYRRRGFVVTQVVDELTRGVAAGYGLLAGCLDLVDQGILRVVSLDRSERNTYRQLVAHLGAGEAGTIAAAHRRQGVVVTDDLAARRTCADMRVAVTGTIGILRAAVGDGDLVLTDANDLLRGMIEAGFYSPVVRITAG
jgi:predicted nucleic acid-binding protein